MGKEDERSENDNELTYDEEDRVFFEKDYIDSDDDAYDRWVDDSMTDFEDEFQAFIKKWYKSQSWYGKRLDRIKKDITDELEHIQEERLRDG